jgi:hypothetical protein
MSGEAAVSPKNAGNIVKNLFEYDIYHSGTVSYRVLLRQ